MKLIVVRKIVLALLASWLSLVIFTDFIVEPTLFKLISSKALAQEIILNIYNYLGSYEVIISVCLFITAGIVFKLFRTKRSAFLFLFATSLIAISLLGRFYLTPEIEKLNTERYTLRVETEEFNKTKKRYDFLRSFYVKLDGVKMLLLFAGIIGSFRASRFDQEKIFIPRKRREL